MTAETSACQDQDLATVWTDPQGVPEHLFWCGRRFVVMAQPIAWQDHAIWWETPARVARGTGRALVERPMWQVTARALDNGQILIFDLAVTAGHQWPVTGIYD
ncbi:DUF6504 family protein [Nesterenkonia alba]|uniref:DUF6504 family protein n=1 Tax=Nesterenkonia alba TaxID=515814 RepID=UPI0003B3B63A|nr:DUF6504 family protein [Nesterenkonia alba]